MAMTVSVKPVSESWICSIQSPSGRGSSGVLSIVSSLQTNGLLEDAPEKDSIMTCQPLGIYKRALCTKPAHEPGYAQKVASPCLAWCQENRCFPPRI